MSGCASDGGGDSLSAVGIERIHWATDNGTSERASEAAGAGVEPDAAGAGLGGGGVGGGGAGRDVQAGAGVEGASAPYPDVDEAGRTVASAPLEK